MDPSLSFIGGTVTLSTGANGDLVRNGVITDGLDVYGPNSWVDVSMGDGTCVSSSKIVVTTTTNWFNVTVVTKDRNTGIESGRM